MSEVLQTLEPLDVRIPNWDLTRLESRPCPLCGDAADGLLLRPDGLPVAYCGPCGLWYVCKLPQESAILEFYNTYFEDFRPRDLSSRVAAQMMAGAKISARHDMRVLRLYALLGGLRGKRILDVGCGLGYFLVAARALGAEVLGIEVSPEACEFVGKRLGIPVKCKPFEQCAAEVEPVDAVVMSNLIEHVKDPRQYVLAAHALLRERGVLLLHTPNGGAAGDSIATALNWVGFRVDLEHIQYFSARTMRCLARDATWQIEHLETFGFPDLRGINRPPPAPVRQRVGLRDVLRHVPGARAVARALRAAVKEFLPEPPDPRQGSYHLFCVLRKSAG